MPLLGPYFHFKAQKPAQMFNLYPPTSANLSQLNPSLPLYSSRERRGTSLTTSVETIPTPTPKRWKAKSPRPPNSALTKATASSLISNPSLSKPHPFLVTCVVSCQGSSNSTMEPRQASCLVLSPPSRATTSRITHCNNKLSQLQLLSAPRTSPPCPQALLLLTMDPILEPISLPLHSNSSIRLSSWIASHRAPHFLKLGWEPPPISKRLGWSTPTWSCAIAPV